MASRFYALDKGQQQESVTEAATTQSKSVEIAIDLADFTATDTGNRSEVIRCIEAITAVIMQDTWPPA